MEKQKLYEERGENYPKAIVVLTNVLLYLLLFKEKGIRAMRYICMASVVK